MGNTTVITDSKPPKAKKKEKTLKKIVTSPFQFFVYAIKGFIFSITHSYMIVQCIFEIIVYAFKGLKYTFIETPKNLWLATSGGVDQAYKSTKVVVKETSSTYGKFKKQLSDWYHNLSFVKNNLEKLETEKQVLLDDLNSEDAKRAVKATVYQYVAKNKEGKLITGYFTGYSKLDVNSFLINEGHEVYKIETNNWINFRYGQSGLITRKLKNTDLIFWLTQLATYIKSGITLTDSVKILSNQMKSNDSQKRIFESIVYELNMGETFSGALEKQGTIFPSLLINMLKAAEATGDLEETLDDMANYYNETEKTRKQMISAMTYPSIILVFATVVITFILLYVVPQFIDVYESINAEINGLTAAVLQMSNFVQENAIVVLLILVVITAILVFFYKKIKAFRTFLQKFAMKTPILGNIIIYKEITIFTKTFSSLLKNNVFITDSIDILSKVTNNEIYKAIMFNTIANIAKGEKISLAFRNHWAVPEVAYHMIMTGESTGELATMMSHVSDYFQEMNKNSINTLKSFIEPIMIILLALIVGVIVLAVIIPMFDLYGTIQTVG